MGDVPASASLEATLDAQRPDFLVNVTAPTAHHAVTLAALERGIAVLSEKPLAATLAEAVEMIAAADRAERLLMVSQNRRYMPELVAFRDTVRRLGPLSDLTCEFYVAHREQAAEFLFVFAQPLLLDMAIHLFDGARAITGADPVSVYCESHNPPWSWYAGPAAASAIFRMSGDLRFTFTGNWAADGFRTSWTGSWRAIGERGTAVWDGEGIPRVEPGPGARVTASRPDPGPARPDPLPRPRGRPGRLRGGAAHGLAAPRRMPRQHPQPGHVPRRGRVGGARRAGGRRGLPGELGRARRGVLSRPVIATGRPCRTERASQALGAAPPWPCNDTNLVPS